MTTNTTPSGADALQAKPPGIDALQCVIASMRDTAHFSDEEGELTNDLRTLRDWALARAALSAAETQASGQAPSAAMSDEIEGLRAHVALLKAALAQAERENDELRAELQARQWQPIETAPHETLVVLGWHDENGVFKQEIGLASAGTRYPGGASDMWWHGRATQWMPLPPAPPQGETAC